MASVSRTFHIPPPSDLVASVPLIATLSTRQMDFQGLAARAQEQPHGDDTPDVELPAGGAEGE